MKYVVSAVLLLLSLTVFGQDDEAAVMERVEEIENWSPATGTWEGHYGMEAAPKELFQQYEDAGEDFSKIGIRIVFEDDYASLFIQWDEGGEFSEVGSESYLIPDIIGSHVIVMQEGGLWHERWTLSFIRVEEEIADIMLTRTVHNWYMVDGEDAPETYYVFGAGRVTRTSGSPQ